jgi:hypothetical protein
MQQGFELFLAFSREWSTGKVTETFTETTINLYSCRRLDLARPTHGWALPGPGPAGSSERMRALALPEQLATHAGV